MTETFKIGDLVQWSNDVGSLIDGVVASIIPPTILAKAFSTEWRSLSWDDRHKCEESYVVKTETGTEHTINNMKLFVRDTAIEREFRHLNDEFGRQIQTLLTEAGNLIVEARQIAEKHGLPFRSAVSELGQSYCPHSFRKLYPDLDEDAVKDITSSDYIDTFGGWCHSQVGC